MSHFLILQAITVNEKTENRFHYLNSPENSWKRNYQAKKGLPNRALMPSLHLFSLLGTETETRVAFIGDLPVSSRRLPCILLNRYKSRWKSTIWGVWMNQTIKKMKILGSFGAAIRCFKILKQIKYFSLQQWDYIQFIFVLTLFEEKKKSAVLLDSGGTHH